MNTVVKITVLRVPYIRFNEFLTAKNPLIKSYLCVILVSMALTFYKYHGTGNDFIMIDNREHTFPKEDTAQVAQLCHRRFGIGADGLILLEEDSSSDFAMVYYNSDGNQSSMCGNGGRCIVAFAQFLGIITDTARFRAIDGLHHATIDGEMVSLEMKDVSGIRKKENYAFLDTGSPHHVQLVSGLSEVDVVKEGAKLRYGLYGEKGSNINFVEANGQGFAVRTYERGVENETLSCGTGVTAVALAMHHSGEVAAHKVKIKTPGGHLEVRFEEKGGGYGNIRLIGPAKKVFKGEIHGTS